MNWFNILTKPALMVIWSTCIILSILDIYYIRNMEKNWSLYDNQLLESNLWWLFGIPLCVYSLVIEISLLILTIFSYKITDNDFEIEDFDKEYRNYNSNFNHNYSTLYDYTDEYTCSVFSWIDNVGLWNRLIFLITNFLGVMTLYYAYLGLIEYQTRSLTFLIKSCIIIIAALITWIPGVINSFIESLKLFGIVSGCSLILILFLCSRNYRYENKVSELTSEILNINKLSKGDEIVNERIIERYIESGGKYYTISSSPAAIATELYWGKMAMKTLKENKSYIDCDFNSNNNKWKNCIEEKVTSYPSWVIGDKTISGIIEPITIAHMVNINIKELKNEVLSLVHPDEKKEIEKKISDIIPNDSDDEDQKNNKKIEIESINSSKLLDIEDNYRFNSKQKRKKIDKKKEKQHYDSDKNVEEEEKLINSIYDQPSFRGLNVINELEEKEENLVDKNLIKENIDFSINTEHDDIKLKLPSKEEFDEFNDNINNAEKAHLNEVQIAIQNADEKIDNIENDLNDQVIDSEVVGDFVSEHISSESEIEYEDNKAVEFEDLKEDKTTKLNNISDINEINSDIDPKKVSEVSNTNDEGLDEVNINEGSEYQNNQNNEEIISEIINTDEVNN
ncbi:thioredoxin/PDI [Cryptosporidium ryanae]|uniref:thioredoxin/PDI n=1 Tax=Cryptosporidium ryanae TaxID=515981 RepID=UPI00351A6349|nr:thioredoxin/PDI [Cryptosporidium ryanae]